jgi:hypothetical protein
MGSHHPCRRTRNTFRRLAIPSDLDHTQEYTDGGILQHEGEVKLLHPDRPTQPVARDAGGNGQWAVLRP